VTDSKPSASSKSARKREHLARQKLGESLVGLGDSDLRSLPIDDTLRQAIRDAAAITSRAALRRQRQFIGKLMGDVDTAALVGALEALGARERREKRRFGDAERWRDRILADGEEGLSAFETETGETHAELRHLLAELRGTENDRREKTLRREIFRSVHAILGRILP
jgi:ribosome-associated protein